ncbi:MAG TPA: phosphate-starvation-inducible PsiE family protein [Methylococcaceae bacterium]|nr:phosphate-starvation-inducible PsiE family protein [Methylococcaceae bacterium]
MIQLTYISTATRPMTADDLMDILRSARAHNANHGVTGMLLYSNGTFVQVLEGDERTVDALLEVIKRDPRHTTLHVVERRTIEAREYAEWSMGFKRLGKDALRGVPGLNGFFESDFNSENLGDKLALINKLLGHFRREEQRRIIHDELSLDDEDKFIVMLHRFIRVGVKALAVLMVLTILYCVADVAVVIFEKLIAHPISTLEKTDILQVFGSFLIVLIAVEIFINITLYIRSHVIPVKLVVATALMAVARKIIVFDFHEVSAMHVLATGVVVLALGGTYWLLEREFNPHSER